MEEYGRETQIHWKYSSLQTAGANGLVLSEVSWVPHLCAHAAGPKVSLKCCFSGTIHFVFGDKIFHWLGSNQCEGGWPPGTMLPAFLHVYWVKLRSSCLYCEPLPNPPLLFKTSFPFRLHTWPPHLGAQSLPSPTLTHYST